jgi:hypothetical protein
VLIRTQRTFRVASRDVTVFQLDDTGAQILDPRQRKLLRHGPADPFTSGLRSGDLVGHVLATLTTDAQGGPRVDRLRRTEPLAKSLVTDTLDLAAWLRPAPPAADARLFTDRRPAPRTLLRGATGLERELRLDPKAKGLAAGLRRYLVRGSGQLPEAPKGLAPPKGKAPGSPSAPKRVELSGAVTFAPGALLPTHAELTITGLPGGRPPITEIRLELKALGSGCNR